MSEVIKAEGPKFINRTNYFNDLAQRYLPEMRLLLKGGKLTRREEGVQGDKLSQNDKKNWIVVVEHCLTEVAAAEELTTALGLTDEEKERLCKVVAVHDWDKRINKSSDDFSDEDNARAEQLLAKVNPDLDLLYATGEQMLKDRLDGKEFSFLQRVQRYIDDICDDSNIVPVAERLQKAKVRAPHLETKWKEEIEKVLGSGKNYFDAELLFAQRTQQEIFERLAKRGIKLDSPDSLPEFIKSRVQANYTVK